MKSFNYLCAGILSLATLFTNVDSLKAGTVDSTAAHISAPGNEVFISVLPAFNLINSNHFLSYMPATLGYRRYYKDMAFRAVLSRSYQSNSYSNTTYYENDPGFNTISGSTYTQNTQFKLGIQFNKAFCSHLRLYYGADLIGSYGMNHSMTEQKMMRGFANITSDNTNTTNIKSLGYGIAGILGIQYFATRNIAIGVEGNLTWLMQKQTPHYTTESKELQYDGSVLPGSERSSSSRGSSANVSSFQNTPVNRPYSLNVSVFF